MPRFDMGGLSIFYHDEGQGEPVVLIHGFPLSNEMYQPQRAALSQYVRVITPDLRGMGRSDVPSATSAYSIDTYADDIVALLDDLGIAEATVGGMSMGGYILFAMLRRHPHRIRGVILIDTKATADTEEAKANRRNMAEQARNEGTAAIAETMLPKMLSEQTRTKRPELVEFVREMMVNTPVDGIVGAQESMIARPDSTDMLPSINVPTLIIVGSEDPLTPPSVAEEMHRAIPNSEFVVIEGAAHAANLERPDEINRAILQWLDRTFDVGV